MTKPEGAPRDAAGSTVTILIADDDPDDRLLIKEALEEAHFDCPIEFFTDGVDLLDYLHGRGEYARRPAALLPGLLFLDLNMPRMDGREALQKIKQDPHLRRIPVVVLTTSKAEEDVLRSYSLGANSFIVKPVSFDGLVDVMRRVDEYWFEMVRLPTHAGAA